MDNGRSVSMFKDLRTFTKKISIELCLETDSTHLRRDVLYVQTTRETEVDCVISNDDSFVRVQKSDE